MLSRQEDNFVSKLVSGTIIINLIVTLMVGISLYNTKRHFHHLAEITTQNMAKSMEENLSDIFDKIDIGLSAVQREAERQLATGRIKKSEMNTYIQQQVAQLPELIGMIVTDAEGNIRYGTDITAGKPVNISDRNYFRQLQENPKAGMVVSSLIRGRVSGKWSLTLAKRINRPDGAFNGIVFGIFQASYFDNLFSQLDIGKGGAIGIRDLEFTLIALQPKGQEPGSQIGSRVISQKTRDIIAANPVTATYLTVFARDNKERMVTFRKAARYPFLVFATIAPGDYLAPWRTEAAIFLTLLAIFILATIISSRMIYKSRETALLHMEAKQYGEEMERKNKELEASLSRIKRLEGIIPICSYCKKIRNEEQSWEQLEKYLSDNSDAMFSHGICPECGEKLMKDLGS
jgi:hypothetical protein